MPICLHKKDEVLNLIDIVQFQRQQDDPWEKGLRLNDGNLGIIDQHGVFINECWDYIKTADLSIDVSSFFAPSKPFLLHVDAAIVEDRVV